MKALLEGRFSDYLAGPAPPLWLFVHVPKTAGSSLSTEIAARLVPYANIAIDYADAARPADARFTEATEAFLRLHRAVPHRFASGHLRWRQVAMMRGAVPGLGLFTLLRDPLRRLVSDFFYQRSAAHPNAADAMRRAPDFEAFTALPGQRNRAAIHLLPRPLIEAGDAEAAIAHVARVFRFVGVQEMYGLCFRILMRLLGLPDAAPVERVRVGETTGPEMEAISRLLADPAFVAEIEARNALDLALHRHFAAAWARIAAPLDAFLDGRAA